MTTVQKSAIERFAQLSDAPAQSSYLPADWDESESALIALAGTLRASAEGMAPDPEFVAELRNELRLRATTLQRDAAELSWAPLETAIGLLGVVHRHGLVVFCTVLESEAAFARRAARTLGAFPGREDELPAKLSRGIRDHLAGRSRLRAIDLSWLPAFQRRVLEKTAEIPRGEVRPYGWIAREIGAPGAVRAVGTALGHNPIPFLVPCHRVVRADGSLGEYSGGGPQAKARILALEGAPLAELQERARRGERLMGSRTTRIACYPSCHAARRTRAENVVVFASLAGADAAGYRACRLCRPA